GPGPATQPAPQPGPATQPGAQGPAPRSFVAPATTRPASVWQRGATTRPAQQLSLHFKDASADAVLTYLSQTAGFIIMKDAPVEGRVNIDSEQPVTPDEALILINAALKTNGLTAIQQGRVLRILRQGDAKKIVPVRYGNKPEEIPETDEMITQVIPVGSVDAAKLKQDLAPLISLNADFAANQGSNSLIMTDTSASIRRVVTIVSILDKRESSQTDMRVIQLKNASATSAAKLVTSIFKTEEPQQQQQQGGRGGRGGGGQFPGGFNPFGGGTGSSVEDALRGGKVSAAADDRTNTLVITGPTETLKVIDGIIKKLDDQDVHSNEIQSYPLTYADATATAKLITSIFKTDDTQQQQQQFPFFGPGGRGRGGGNGTSTTDDALQAKVNAVADDRTNTVIVTAPTATQEVVARLIHKLDSNPITSSVMQVFKLKYADATDASKLILSIFQPDQTSSQSSGNNGGGGGFGRFQQTQVANTNQQHGTRILAAADARTNTLVVTAPGETMKLIIPLVNSLESDPAAENTFFIHRLKNAQASNLQSVLNTLFGATNGGGSTSGTSRSGNNSLSGSSSPFGSNSSSGSPFGGGSSGGIGSSSRSGGTGSGSSRGSGSFSSGTNGSNPFGNGSNTNGGGSQQLSSNSSRAATELTGQVFVVADLDTNALIVTTASKYKEQVLKIIEELDRPVPQVLIKVLIAEVTHDNAADWGIDFTYNNLRANGNGQKFGADLFNAAAATNGGFVFGLVEKNVNVTLHALATQGKLDVLSRPYILASDNQLANITVGQEVPFVQATQLTSTGQTNNVITYSDVGIILNVIPHINGDGMVVMDVAPEISQLTSTTVQVTNGNNAPVISKRSAQSRVTIRNGQTIVIGGLMEDRKLTTITKVPILGDIPLIGELFRRTQADKSKTELLIFLTPHVAQQPDTLKPMSDDEMRGTKLTPNAVEPGTFDDQMRGMHRGDVHEAPSTQPATQPGLVTPRTPMETRVITPAPGPQQ
ncbi:MAG: putative type secretion system protein, partial [Phycisphaerales bacterium]|nr:putative type secretion system protein [Phycisphaerales bacterium]